MPRPTQLRRRSTHACRKDTMYSLRRAWAIRAARLRNHIIVAWAVILKWHGRGRRFEPVQVHHNSSNTYRPPTSQTRSHRSPTGVQTQIDAWAAWASRGFRCCPRRGLQIQGVRRIGHRGHRFSRLLFAGDDNKRFPYKDDAHCAQARAGPSGSRFDIGLRRPVKSVPTSVGALHPSPGKQGGPSVGYKGISRQ